MKFNKKIEAFTLSEMIVVLLLTSVVVGLAFTILNLVQQHMYSIQKNYSVSNELNTLETALWLDFNRFQKMTFNKHENALKFYSEIDSTSYFFYEHSIVKEQDTFELKFEIKQFYFSSKPVWEGSVDAIKLETTKDFQNRQLFVFKTNDATAFMH